VGAADAEAAPGIAVEGSGAEGVFFSDGAEDGDFRSHCQCHIEIIPGQHAGLLRAGPAARESCPVQAWHVTGR
jgi:hypothetical protein